jgi:hypothetical protein
MNFEFRKAAPARRYAALSGRQQEVLRRLARLKGRPTMNLEMSVVLFVIPAEAQGCPGKILRRQKWSIAASAFVLAGLDPWAFSPRTGSVGIHAFDACNEDVDTRDKPAQDDFLPCPARSANTV